MGEITKGRAGIRWEPVVEKMRRNLWGDQEEVLSIEAFVGYKAEVKEKIEERERQALRSKVNEGKHLDIYGGLREDIEMKTHLHGPMDYARKLELRYRVGGLDLPERRNRCTIDREEGGVAINMCSCGTAIESRTIRGEYELDKEERDALEEEKRKIDVCDMEDFGRLESSKKTIASLVDGGRRRRNRTGIG